MIEKNEGPTERVEKHIELDASINSIDSISESLENLISRITGSDSRNSFEDCVKESSPNLSQTLETGSLRIKDKIASSHKLIGEIYALLF